MAISAGAETVHSSINGLGERTGNVATEEIAFALQHLFNIDAGIDLSQIAVISEIVAEISKVPRARNKPMVGSALFEVESGIVVHVLESMKAAGLGAYSVFPFDPKAVGREELVVIAGRGTGRHTVEMFLAERGLKADEATIARITERIKNTGLVLKNALPKSLLDEIITEEVGRSDAAGVAQKR
jgi:isopropylmalate/homocitrate/citramalate synthase